MDTFAGLTKDCDILGVVKSFEQDYMLVDTLVKDCKRCVGKYVSQLLLFFNYW